MNSITSIVNVYRRPQNLQLQVDAIADQTELGEQTWVWRNYHQDGKDLNLDSLWNVDRWIDSNFNWKFYGRFAAALLATTEYVAIFDDDTIPGKNWFKNCLETMQTSPGILGSAGVILNSGIYANHVRSGWPSQNEKIERVDLVGHAWFFKTEWLKYLWSERPFTFDNGEDIQFSYLAQKYGSINTFTPPHPRSDQSLHGSILGEKLGIDNKATSCNNEVSFSKFFNERDLCVQNAIRNGWKTVKEISL